MRQFWSLTLMVLAGCLLILGSEYSLQGDDHHYRHQVVAKIAYNQKQQQTTITGRTKQGVIVTIRRGKQVRQVISNKQDGRFLVRLAVKGQKRVVVQVKGLKAVVLTVPVASKR
ncbi:hypothetical protein C5Z25_11375 [Lactobacillus sp. CBA3605]|uniref:hypothetical protein n=1 Tax=Lactobacillus sp. CBA3605 TaxID=2099788 RepID=UPI000CFA99FD|nr:hypothetical protein [Lactobacillus sp. CBA3605]AVK62322.1 hypothetical protein C5Z25_11375 [Lactobacillus sp. CBA3605]